MTVDLAGRGSVMHATMKGKERKVWVSEKMLRI